MLVLVLVCVRERHWHGVMTRVVFQRRSTLLLQHNRFCVRGLFASVFVSRLRSQHHHDYYVLFLN